MQSSGSWGFGIGRKVDLNHSRSSSERGAIFNVSVDPEKLVAKLF